MPILHSLRPEAPTPSPSLSQLASTTLDSGTTVSLVSRAALPTRHGEFQIYAFRNDRDHKDHVAVVSGDIENALAVPTRLHSECLTGDVFGSLRCDCREQLEVALQQLSTLERGIILYMRQEGRGIGLANKIAAYSLQDEGLDTVEANLHLGFDDDMREYDVAAGMLELLEVSSINLMTNNPKKIDGLRRYGAEITERTPILIPPNPHNKGYLDVKRKKSGHLL